jgi:hypothetical protein
MRQLRKTISYIFTMSFEKTLGQNMTQILLRTGATVWNEALLSIVSQLKHQSTETTPLTSLDIKT